MVSNYILSFNLIQIGASSIYPTFYVWGGLCQPAHIQHNILLGPIYLSFPQAHELNLLDWIKVEPCLGK